MKQLNVQELPIDRKVIIEASAGTGKTFTIGLIVLRLLLEKLLPIEKIVVITFTDAATAELKKSTSEKIIEAYNIWKNGSDEKTDLTAIIGSAKQEDRQRREANLLDAIARIDEMPVFSIHGFCNKLLHEFAYEIGTLEKMETVTDSADIKEAVIADFWRENIQNLDVTAALTPKELSDSTNVVLNHPQAKLDGENYEQSLIEYRNTDDEKTAGEKLKYAIACKLAKEIRGKLADEKKKLKKLDFNDMIENCHNAIKNDHERILQNAVKNGYKAILVDEFQDTDRTQFEIFDYLFDGMPFFIIGDPKQAIYRFRGGDIFAYKESRNSAGDNQFSMNINYRSEKSLLDALNSFFDAESFRGKMGSGIDYHNVECGKPELEPVIKKDDRYRPFVIWKGQDNEHKKDFEPKAQKAVISEINRLLSSGKFKPQDISILLDNNEDCRAYKNALTKERIPAIVIGGSVFSSESANFIRILLNAVCCDNNIRYLKTLLTHSFIGLEPKAAEKVFMEWIGPIRETKEKWERYGVMNSIDFFMNTRNLWGHIAGSPNGERNIANIRQIMDILYKEETNFGKIPEKINNRFAALCSGAEKSDEAEEKLETDENALKIMTIHKSKGLQFNIVFVPDVSRSPRNHKFPGVYMYHENNEEIIAYFAKDEAMQELSRQEENEENVRLLYVALTRAKYRLYVAYSPCIITQKSNISRKIGDASICREIFGKFSARNENITIENLNDVIGNDYPYNTDKKDGKELKMSARSLPEDFSITPAWSRTSFTGITRYFEHEDFAYASPKTETTIPAGKMMGTLLHGIFENLDFNASDSEIQEMVENRLGGFREFSDMTEEGKNNKATIKNWVNTILNKNLQGSAGKLLDIDAGHKVTELNFFMKSDKIDLQRIKEIIGEKIPEFHDAKELPDKYIKGAIDLIFLGKDGRYYILDWKSNRLSDFSEHGMEEEAMRPHGYHLQYYIYAVALKRWLEKTRENFDFKKQFGGVYYIFVRGVNDEDENFDGIYHVIGENIADTVAELDECFKGA